VNGVNEEKGYMTCDKVNRHSGDLHGGRTLLALNYFGTDHRPPAIDFISLVCN